MTDQEICDLKSSIDGITECVKAIDARVELLEKLIRVILGRLDALWLPSTSGGKHE